MKFIPCFLYILSTHALQDVLKLSRPAYFAPTNRVGEPAFVIGISLTTSYGAISVRDADGSFRDIGRVDNDSYVEMMKRLSLPSSRHLSPPYASLDEMWNDAPRHFYRESRKNMGLPASPDVAILAGVIKDLLDLVPSQVLGDAKNASATLTYANVGALYEEDVMDAAEYLGLSIVHTFFKWHEPRELWAAYAGNGMGVCSPEVARDKAKCEAELNSLPRQYVFLVEYTKEALFVQVSKISGAFDSPNSWNSYVAEASFDLGSNSSGGTEYLDQVNAFILRYLSIQLRYRDDVQEMVVMITGDGENLDLIESAVKAVLGELGAVPHFLSSQREYIAARGAADVNWHALMLKNSTNS